ncbi:flippase [Rhabdochromatium marinum]|uniref:flippase n=1 Tax=Rhabdochromatium marinum TaxID=48729 RepID=UPI001904D50C|nr:flippase [Rhabdochromatium marinum]MBK1648836.1 O-unit flippase [Rhabdochromatium marinum]
MLYLIPGLIRHRITHRPNLLKIVKNIGWLFFDKILRMGVGLLVGVWIARYLGPQQFGLLSFATAFVSLFAAIAGLGLQGIVVRDIVRKPDSKMATLGTAAGLQFGGGLIAYGLILGTIFWLRPEDSLVRLLVAILGSVMLFKASDVALYWFESQVLSKYTVWVQNGSFLVFAAIKVALMLLNAPLIAFAWAMMAEALLVAILMVAMLNWRGPGLRRLQVNLTRARQLLTDSWPLLLSGIAIVIYMKIDQIMLGLMIGDEAAGIYSAAVRISELWYFIPMMIVASVFPSILETRKHSNALYYQRLQQLYDLMVWLSVGVAFPTLFFSTPVIKQLFGEAFSASGPILAIHIWAAVFVFLGVAGSQWFLAENRQILHFQRTLLGALVNIALNGVLIPRFGPVGAAIATVISYATAAFLADAFQKETKQMFLMKAQALNIFSSIRRAVINTHAHDS